MTKLTVAIGEPIGERRLKALESNFPEVRFLYAPDPEELARAIAVAEILFSKQMPSGLPDCAPNLRWIQAGMAGVDGLMGLDLAERGIRLTNSSGAHGTPMSELILGMMLSFATGLHRFIRSTEGPQRTKEKVLATKFELAGQTVLVLGLGDIGGSLARRCSALGMHVIGVRRSRSASPDVDEQFRPDDLGECLPRADHVALCLPLTSSTDGIIRRRELEQMKSGSYIYNVGRGASIDPDALIEALESGELAGAGLDVTEPEPLPADSPLRSMSNVILSEHTSGSSPYNTERITRIFVENLRRYMRGEELENRVDLSLGY